MPVVLRALMGWLADHLAGVDRLQRPEWRRWARGLLLKEKVSEALELLATFGGS